MISERCGWVLASSSVIRPSSTSRCTQVWSWVIWVSEPSRSRYARESPMWIRPARSPVHSSAVSVVPMPSSAGSLSTSSRSRSLARSAAWLSAVSGSVPGMSSSNETMVDRTSDEATSPAAWPPMPSATASRRGPA